MGNTSSSSAAALAGCSKSTIVATADTVTGSHVLSVNGYSRTKGRGVGKSIKSGTFTVGGHSWYIAYFPDGERVACASWISVYLYLDKPGAEDDVVKTQFEFNLLNQKGKAVSEFRKTSFLSTFSFANNGARRWGYREFIKRSELECSPHLKNDSFQIRCDVTVIRDREDRVETTTSRSLAVPPSDLHRHIGDLLASQVGADVKFDVHGELFTAHRIVLAARSSVFMSELFGHMKEKATSCIHIDDMDADVFKAMLHFVYTDSLPKIDESHKTVMIQHLLVAADRYNLERLKVICEDMLCSHIDSRTVATTLPLAEQHGCSRLKEASLKFLMSPGNLKAVMATDDFEHMMSSCPSLLKELLAKVAP